MFIGGSQPPRAGGVPCHMRFFGRLNCAGASFRGLAGKDRLGLSFLSFPIAAAEHEMIRRPAGLHGFYSRSLRPPDAVSILWHLLMQKMAVT